MCEAVELDTFTMNCASDSDCDEYHEITETKVDAAELSSICSYKNIDEYDFFVKTDVQIGNKCSEKKKRVKKKEKSATLMDIISLELAAVAAPLTENIITVVDTYEQQARCMSKVPFVRNIFQKSQALPLDFEHGWSSHSRPINISPIFPRVLDNVVAEDIDIPVQYVEPTMFKKFIINNVNNENGAVSKFLDITIKDIRFKHHHTFSLEMLIFVKLMECCNGYTNTKKIVKDLAREIKINRETRDNLRQELLKVSPNKKEDIRFDPAVRKYTEKLIKTKQKYFEMLKAEREKLHQLTSLWADIEMIREKTGRVSTPIIIDIKTNTLDEKDFEEEWNQVFNAEFSDLLSKIEFEYVTKYIEYKEMKNDQNIEYSRRKKLCKPRLVIDEDVLKNQVEEVVNNMVTKDRVNVKFKYDESILSYWTKLNKDSFYYHYEIYVDDVFVCDSDKRCNDNNNLLGIEFVETFSVQILPINRTLTIFLLENNEKISLLKKNITEIRKSYTTSDFTTELFVCDNIIEPNTKQVGSGYNIKEIAKENKVRLKSSNTFIGKLYTTFESKLKIGWNDKFNQNQSENIKSSMEIGRRLKRLLHGIDKPNIEALADVISQIFGKDIENDDKVINTLRMVCKPGVISDHAFPVPDEKSPEFIRLKLLYLRNAGGLTNVENKQVPLHGNQISTEQLRCLQKSNEKEFDIEYINSKYVDADPIELQRFIGAKYVQKLNKNMLRNLNEHLLKKTHKDVVRDFKDLSLRSFFSNKVNLTTFAKISGSTKNQMLKESLCKEQEIQVSVLRAFNLLDRREGILSEETDESDRIAGFKVRPLRPFVRISYHGSSVQTATAIGCHPTWNQTLKIKEKPNPLSSIYINVYDEYRSHMKESYNEDDLGSRIVQYRYYNKWLGTLQIPLFTVLTIGSLKGTFKISTPPLLFGYESLSQMKDNTQSLIPAVTQLLKKDMSFISLHISTNLSHLGESQVYNLPIPRGPDDDYLIQHLNNFVTDFINDFPLRNLSLTFIESSGTNKCVIQFLQPIPPPDYEWFPKNPKNVGGSALSKSSNVSKSSSSKSSGGRRLELETEKESSLYEEKESIYSAREASWRSGETQLTKIINACVRYVALIPTYEVTESHVVTLLGLELLKVLHGSPLDHTILLASYFIYLGVRCWVAVGLGLPRGPSSYVLTKYDLNAHRVVLVSDQLFKKGFFNKNDGYLWNVYDAVTGDRYELRDVSCPLKTVDYVFDNENIWVNVQSSQDCENISFDFEKSSNWQPVFDKTVFVMKQPVVTDNSLYRAPTDTVRLREGLETKIRNKVQKWRPQMKTIWNRYCSGLLREVLPLWEYWSFNPTEPKPGLSQRLKQLVTYKMYGFPLNMCNLNTKAVVSSVKSTGVHLNDDSNAEFALAVEVYGYPNNVISVWVFLTCITRI